MLSEAERQVTGKDSELSGRIKLFAGGSHAHISEAVAEFAIQYPRIELDITVSDHRLTWPAARLTLPSGASQSINGLQKILWVSSSGAFRWGTTSIASC